MRIVFSGDWYSEGMGYMENVIPKRFAELGHEVYLITSTMQVYGDHSFYEEVYQRYLGPPITDPSTKSIDGVVVMRLPIVLWWKRFRIAKERTRIICDLKPDIVYAWDPRSYQAVMLSLAAWIHSFKLFTGNHTVASVYPAYQSFETWPLHKRIYLRLTDTLLGWIAARRTSIAYASTPDAADISVRFFGAPKERVRHLPLGLDTAMFRPCTSQSDREERDRARSELGLAAGDIACIYTGRLTAAKNPHCLAAAVEILRGQGRPFRAIFLGEGEQAASIASTDGCTVMPFVPYPRLARLYRAADIGVWPCQESISLMDAAACGLPVVASNRVKALERIEGNGMTYEENDSADLANALRRLEDAALRAKLGSCGAEKMAALFSVEHMTNTLLADFKAALET